MVRLKTVGAVSLAIALSSSAIHAEPVVPSSDTLLDDFREPPNSARPRVWWHWMNGNITKEGITADLDWMQRVGIGGLQNFDIDLYTPVLVPNRLAYMTQGWKDAFKFAAREADSRGLELTIASSPGWSETGGPWVQPEDGLKKVVWSATFAKGGQKFDGKLPALPNVTGPFQDLPMYDATKALLGEPVKASPQHVGDIAVFAIRNVFQPLPVPKVSDRDGKILDSAALLDVSLSTAVNLERGSTEKPTFITYDFGKPVTVRSATFFSLGAKALFTGASIKPSLSASSDGSGWEPVADITAGQVPTSLSFRPVTARYFRLTIFPTAPGGSNLGNAAPGIAAPPFAKILMAGGDLPMPLNTFRLSAEPMIDRFEAKAGFTMVDDYYSLDSGASEASPPEEIIDLTGRMKPDGSLEWTPPKGNWEIVRMGYSLLGTTNHPAPAEATGLEVDKFDGDAVRRYLDHYLGMYSDAVGPGLMGERGVQGLLTDSIEVGAANWTPRLIARFEELRGYDPRPWLPALAGFVVRSRPESDKFLYDFRRTLADLMASEHYAVVAKQAHARGLKVYGEALEDHRPSLGDDMEMRRYADIPMSALWTFPADGKPVAGHVADMKGAASVAHIYGKKFVAAESMTSALRYWADGPQSLKHVIDLEFVTGINRPVIHTSVLSPDDAGEPGLSLMIFGQYFNRHDAWAELAKPWVDYLARNSFMLQQGTNVADVAYFFGEEGPLTALYGDTPVADAPIHYAYDFINPGALHDAIRNDGDDLVTPGGARYRAIYLGGSSSRMTVGVLKRLVAIAEAGGTIVGVAPVASPSLADDPVQWSGLVKKLWSGSPITQVGNGRVIASRDIEEALASIAIRPDFAYSGGGEGADIPFVHRKLVDGDSYFVVNRKDRAEKIEARFRVTGKAPEFWSAETGTVTAASYRIEGNETIVPLNLAAQQSIHIVFRKTAQQSTLTVPNGNLREVQAVSSPWTVSFPANRGAPPSIILDKLVPLNEHADGGVKYFSGIASYKNSFSFSGSETRSLVLDLGEVHEVAEVFLNGKSMGYVWHAPYQLDLGAGLVKGRNTIEVRVANLWVNRMIGDAQAGAKPLTKTTLPTYEASAPLRRSGLIGPVRILTRSN